MKVDFRRRKERRAHQVQPWYGANATVVANPSLGVEHRQVQPRILGPVARRPDHRLDLRSATGNSRGGDAGTRVGAGRSGGSASPSSPLTRSPLIQGVEQPTELQIGQCALVRE